MLLLRRWRIFLCKHKHASSWIMHSNASRQNRLLLHENSVTTETTEVFCLPSHRCTSNKCLPTTRTVYPTNTERQQNIAGGNSARLRTSWIPLTSNGKVWNYSKQLSAARFAEPTVLVWGSDRIIFLFHVTDRLPIYTQFIACFKWNHYDNRSVKIGFCKSGLILSRKKLSWNQ
jgi:hypothetical protein